MSFKEVKIIGLEPKVRDYLREFKIKYNFRNYSDAVKDLINFWESMP